VTPIHELLARIRYDREYGKGRFEIGYFDRQEGKVQRVAFRLITFPESDRRVLELADEFGRTCRIPFHRVREVWRGGVIIWQRASARPASRPVAPGS
jgi:uncharacterized protein (UPF0248 family)